MGSPKAALTLGGRTLIEIMIEKAKAVTQDVRIVGPRLQFGENAVEDVFPGRGPLAGIHAALRTSNAELNLMLAVDLPFVDPKFLLFLAQQAAASRALVTVPRTTRGWQPLCALYRRDFAAHAERALQLGRNKIDALFSEVEVRIVEEREIVAAGFNEAMFRNINTREDFELAQKRFAERS